MSWTALDEAKHRAQVKMRAKTDAARARASRSMECIFTEANAALMAAASTAEVEHAERCLSTILTHLEGVFDALDR